MKKKEIKKEWGKHEERMSTETRKKKVEKNKKKKEKKRIRKEEYSTYV